MLKKMTTIGLALGLLLPGSVILAETAQEQKENRVRTEKQEMLHRGSHAVGDQERIQEQARTRDEQQMHDQTGDARKEQRAGNQTRDKDLTRDRDRDRVHPASGTAKRGGGR
jgi:hypothetical protein